MLRMRKPLDLAGQTFGNLTANNIVGKRENGAALWRCSCLCGGGSVVEAAALRRGSIKSCGCLQKKSATTHGLSRSPEYRIWIGMKNRCYNVGDPSYAEYGGRGVTVAPEWMDSFDSFIQSIGKRPSAKHSIDRIDNSKGYRPDNCRWATKSEQANNRRSSILITIEGITRSVTEWADVVGVHKTLIYQRLVAGWNPDVAVTKPARAKAQN